MVRFLGVCCGDLFNFRYKLLDQIGDVIREPTIQREGLHVLGRSEYYDELIGFHRAMRQTDRHKDFTACLRLD